ncbi:MAG: MazG nucleotide pyrophosphohydrolase domain-containing protein [Rhizomicrobium sp.]
MSDLLLQVVYHARMAEARGLFDFGDAVDAIGNILYSDPGPLPFASLGRDDARVSPP